MENFKIDVENGLSDNPKTLPSKYFYNKIGDALFVEIMNLPEYYLTRCELDIFTNKTSELIKNLEQDKNNYFDLIELGAGDGLKTTQLLKDLHKDDYKFTFSPIDISANVLTILKQNILAELPDININLRQGDYFNILASLKENTNPKVVLFLGSNIGNMTDETASDFLNELSENLRAGDKLVLGVDLIKAKEIVLPAYNDSSGVTSKFNLNLLERINKELGGDFNLDHFMHKPEYNEQDGIAKSFIVSSKEQTVEIKSLGKSFSFKENEKIHTEISRKYNDLILEKIIANSNFSIQSKIMDSRNYFADYVLVKN